ncbi:MAG: hypothetical protein KatS3mg011_0448 [Acidimicrobiia bacterium]|nr:MAG: hypothetical protein KatS3mg011_0448 [Acidimicrobiia bacterium]
MSQELVAAAAAKLGIPEPLVKRSAEARAKAAGVSVEEILTAWAGGEAAPSGTQAATQAATQAEATAEETTPAAPEPEPAPAPAAAPPQPAPTPPPAAPAAPGIATRPAAVPVLEGRPDRPLAIAAGAVAVFLLTVFAGFAAVAAPVNDNPVYSSRVPYTSSALAGQEVYLAEGCVACHTQMVRPIVADADLGPVTLADTNQVLGRRRIGPDLAHVGSRVESADDLRAVLGGAGGHPRYALDDQTLDDLIAYLMEST